MPVVKSKLTQKTQTRSLVRPPLSIPDFYHRANRILILRSVGGLGDILMHRMMFEDFKLLMPDVEIHFACPRLYHDALIDHPYIDKLLTPQEIDLDNYMLSYNTTTACGRYEMKAAPLAGKHRSDIWANHCGLNLTRHNMHIHLSPEERLIGQQLLESKRDRSGPSVVLAPISAMHNKNLSDELTVNLVRALQDMGLYVLGVHNNPMFPFIQNDLPFIYNLNLRKYLALINQADYTISVDTATFHAAGGLGRPVLGVFTFVNADTYSKYYPKAVTLQGSCPLGYAGCYNWTSCAASNEPLKPCATSLNLSVIMEKVNQLRRNWPALNR